jgi:hypothetical protein
MLHRLAFLALWAAAVSGFAQASSENCTEMLIDTPGSVEARTCFALKLDRLNARLEIVSRDISAAAAIKRAPFSVSAFRRSQADWRRHVASTCWLDVAGAGNASAVRGRCESAHAQLRLRQLESLLASLDGDPIIWPMSDLSNGK